jgi:Na+-transporting NADH:ubiquinone oxidoreductase subunit C
MRDGVSRTLLVTTALCIVCSALVSTVAVGLRERQAQNVARDWQRRVLAVAGMQTDAFDADQVQARFEANVRSVPVTLASGVRRDVHFVAAPGVDAIVIPFEAQGLWSTLKGLLALSRTDASTVVGIDFHVHAETPGLGAEVENPRWRARWQERRAYDAQGRVAIEVIKGVAAGPAEDPHRVDGISGATITSQGVSRGVRHWLGDEGFGPFLAEQRMRAGAR